MDCRYNDQWMALPSLIVNLHFSGDVMNQKLINQLLLYAITCENIELNTLLRQVEEALEGGATLLQLREKSMDEETYLRRAVEVKKVCDRYNVPLIIDDSVNVALKCAAAGVHIGQKDIDLVSARKILGSDRIVGVSAKNVEQAKRAEDCGADYLGVGAIYPTDTKKDYTSTSIETLKDICKSVSIPVVAIGGIKLHNIEPLKGSGIVGVAIVTGIFAAPDVKKASRELRAKAEELFT